MENKSMKKVGGKWDKYMKDGESPSLHCRGVQRVTPMYDTDRVGGLKTRLKS